MQQRGEREYLKPNRKSERESSTPISPPRQTICKCFGVLGYLRGITVSIWLPVRPRNTRPQLRVALASGFLQGVLGNGSREALERSGSVAPTTPIQHPRCPNPEACVSHTWHKSRIQRRPFSTSQTQPSEPLASTRLRVAGSGRDSSA